MLARLDYVRIEPQRILDLGCGTGASLTALHERYPGALLIGADLCENMLRASQASRSRVRWLMPFLRRQRTPLLAADARRSAVPAAVDRPALVEPDAALA
jgi:malonyl-CoA O-methyltransferase